MKYIIYLLILLIPTVSLFSDDGIIELKSKSKTEDISDDLAAKGSETEDNSSRDFLDRGQGKKIIPKALFVGQLDDIYNDSDLGTVYDLVNQFFESISLKKQAYGISEDFRFIFNTVYKDTLLNKELKILNWYIGSVKDSSDIIIVPVEVHIGDNKLFYGNLYLDKSESLLINDVQLEKKEKIIFDSSSPLMLF